MRVLRALSPLIVAIGIAAMATPAQATGGTAILNITVTSLNGGCSAPSVCVKVTVDNPQPGTIELELTGHTPGDKPFVDTGAPHQTITLDASHTTYTACFGDVTQFVSDKGFNTLRVEVASASAGITGTDTKSNPSFSLCGTPTPTPSAPSSPTPSAPSSPTPSAPSSPSPSAPSSPTPSAPSSPGGGGGGGTPSPTPSMTAAAALAQTGGLDGGLLLAGLTLLVAGLALFLVARARKGEPGTSR